MRYEKKYVQYNYSSRQDKIKYIVIHDTGNKNISADSEAHFSYFNSGNKNSSAHIFVDNFRALEIIDLKHKAWHCGDGEGAYGITNDNSIGVEMCINEDGVYETMLQNTIEVVKMLMSKYNISISNVVRHYDASRKNCPGTMSHYNWKAWHEFKSRLSGNTTGSSSNNSNNSYVDNTVKDKMAVTTDVLNVREGAGTNFKKIGELKKGDKVKLFKKVGDWYSIYYGNSGGYIHGDYVKVKSDSPNWDNSVKDKYGVVNTDVLNVRYTPNGDLIGQLKKGAKVKMWRVEGDWIHIYSPVAGYNQAYVHKNYIDR